MEKVQKGQVMESTAKGADKEPAFKVKLWRQDLSFSAGHISTYGEEMEGQHGHNYQISLELEGVLDQDGLVIDFRQVKRILRSILSRLNHRTLVPRLNPGLQITEDGGSTKIQFGREHIELPSSSVALLPIRNLTSELLAHHFFESLKAQLSPSDRARLHRITVEIIESPGQSASFSGRM